jgi:nitrogen regulatory protein P-II 1
MKLIMTYIRPEQLPDIKEALFEAEIRHFTATMVMGTANKTEQQMYRGVEKEVSLFKRVKLELIVKPSAVEIAINALSRGAMKSGGYGKVFISNIDEVVKLWTGERGTGAL